MENMFLICAVVGGTLIACQFVLTLFGLGGDHDASGHEGGMDATGHDVSHHGGGTDGGGAHDATHGNQSSWFFGILSFKTLSAAFAFFGFTGLAALQYDLEPLPILAISLGAGLAALLMVGFLMRSLGQLNADGTMRIDRSVGSRGTVYLPIPGARGGVGKVHVSVFNRTMEYKAITASEALTTGMKVEVVGVVGPDTVEVRST